MARAIMILVILSLMACRDEDSPPQGEGTDGGQDGPSRMDLEGDGAERDMVMAADSAQGGADADPTEGRIEIYVQGDLTPQGFGDGLSGQTPQGYTIGVSQYSVLTGPEAEPILCFDYGEESFVMDMAADNLVGYCTTAELPSGIYTHGRTRVDWVAFTVQGTVHVNNMALRGDLVIFRALSDCSWEGRFYAANEGTITFHSLVDVEIPVTYPDLPDGGGVTFEREGSDLYMIFPYTEPLLIDSNNQGSHWARLHWEIHESFRWSDLDREGYREGEWDVSLSIAESEPVGLYGVAGYYVTSSQDR